MRTVITVVTILLLGATAIASTAQQLQEVTLANGMHIVMQPRAGTQRVDVSLFIHTEPPQDPKQNAIAAVVAHALFYGGRDWIPGYTALVVNQVGGALQTLHTANYTALTITTVPTRLGDAVNLLEEAVRHADFTDYALHRSIRDILKGRKESAQRPLSKALSELEQEFGPFPPSTAEQLNDVSRLQAQKYYQSTYLPDRCTISFAGAFEPAAAVVDVKAYLDDWQPANNSNLPMVSNPPDRGLPIEPLHLAISGQAGYAMVAFEAPSVTSPDYPAFTVMETILGIGHASRMFQDLRNKLALGYDVGVVWRTDKGMPAVATLQWNGRLPTGNRLARLDAEVTGLLSNPPTGEEIARAKAVAETNFLMEHQRLHNLAFFGGWFPCMGLGTNFDTNFPSLLASVTKDDILRVAQHYLSHRLGLLAVPRHTGSPPNP